MATKIGIISDTHSTVAPLQEALKFFSKESVEHIICAGDVVGYGDDKPEETIELLQEYNCLTVIGNHDHMPDSVTDPVIKNKLQTYFDALPKKIELSVENKNIYVVHAHPPEEQHGGIKIMNPDGDVVQENKLPWLDKINALNKDILIIGHTHQVFAEYFGDTLVINPGSTCFNHTCMVLTLPEMKVETIALSSKKPVMVWNWSFQFQK